MKQAAETIQQQLAPFFRDRKEVMVAYLYGSVVSQETFHDVDVAILCEPSFCHSLEAFSRVLRWGSEAEKLLHPRRPLDLRLLNEAPVSFQHEVIRTGVVIFERNRDERVIFEAQVMTLYMDFLPTQRFFNEFVLRKKMR